MQLTTWKDDGIVVVRAEVRKRCIEMVRPAVNVVLRDRLGVDGSSALADVLETYGEAWKKDTMTACMDRLDVRLQTLVTREHLDRQVQTLATREDLRVQTLATCEYLDLRIQALVTRDEFVRGMTDCRVEMHDGFGKLRSEMAGQRTELLRWSFLFWIGQVLTTAGLISLALHFGR